MVAVSLCVVDGGFDDGGRWGGELKTLLLLGTVCVGDEQCFYLAATELWWEERMGAFSAWFDESLNSC
jgi:hypothetical protein